MPHLDKARLHVDSLIFNGVCRGAHTALTSVGSHYGDINFDAIGRGCAPGRFERDILAIGSSATRGAEVLAGTIRL